MEFYWYMFSYIFMEVIFLLTCLFYAKMYQYGCCPSWAQCCDWSHLKMKFPIYRKKVVQTIKHFWHE